jgi:ADP-ribosylglycohydrolase
MTTNRETLGHLFASELIDLHRSPLFDQAPGPMPARVPFDRIEGMLLGLAIGDALGATTEGQLPHVRRQRFGEIRDYLPNRHAGNRAVGVPSDDSQLAFWTLEQMIADRGFVPEHVAERFCRQQIFGIGKAVSEFVANYRSGTRPWYRCSVRSAGNGALMRIAPLLIPHLRTGTADLWADTALAAMITHNDAGSIAACLAFVDILWQALRMAEPPPPAWWLERYVATARDLEGQTQYRSRSPFFATYTGPLWRFAEEHVAEAYRQDVSILDACNRWYSAAFLMETIPSVLYILMRHGADPEAAIVRAVNDTKDNDTIAAIVGAAVGALHGAAALPERWRANLLGRTGADDDGQVDRLLEEAKALWWPDAP